MKIRVAIVDDDLFIREDLRQHLARLGMNIHIIGDFQGPEEALPFIRNFRPDVLLLDIRMPGMTGFDMLDEMDEPLPEVIFITSYDEYAIRAIRYSALDYLLKPVNPAELRTAIGRYQTKSELIRTRDRAAALRHNLSQSSTADFRLAVPSRGGEMYYPTSEILRLEADRNYTWIHLTNKTKTLASKPLKDFEEMLAEQDFIRAHKSHLVNRLHISHLTANHHISMTDGTLIEVARRRWTEVRRSLITS